MPAELILFTLGGDGSPLTPLRMCGPEQGSGAARLHERELA